MTSSQTDPSPPRRRSPGRPATKDEAKTARAAGRRRASALQSVADADAACVQIVADLAEVSEVELAELLGVNRATIRAWKQRPTPQQ